MKKFKNTKANFRAKGSSRPASAPNRAGQNAQASARPRPEGRVVVGLHATREMLKVRALAVSELWIKEGYAENRDLNELVDLAQAKAKNIRIRAVASSVLDKIVTSHQGVVAFCTESPELNWQALKAKSTSTLVALDEVEDPHNVGAVLRTAWLFACDGLLLPEHRSAHFSPAVSKVAQGALEYVPMDRDHALAERLKQLKDLGYWVLGLSHTGAKDLFSLEIPEKVIWVLGSESSGLRKPVEKACDELIRIPQANPSASYNVSVAAAVALAETHRQRRKAL
jgi:23S rRNA (guanosine2251-2'-O)-methyltransferase